MVNEAEALKLQIVKDKPKLGDLLPEPKIYAPRKLDVACGQNKQAGFKGIDLAGDADIVHDLFSFPWPIKTGCVAELFCSHFVEHIPHYRPEFNGTDGWWLFFGEVYRIMRKGGTARFVHPYLQSVRAFMDPTHERFIPSETWQYLYKPWREREGIDHYGAPGVNFETLTIAVDGIPDDVATRAEDVKLRMLARDWNVVANLDVVLKKL